MQSLADGYPRSRQKRSKSSPICSCTNVLSGTVALPANDEDVGRDINDWAAAAVSAMFKRVGDMALIEFRLWLDGRLDVRP